MTGLAWEIDHSQSCHTPGAAGKYQTGERDMLADDCGPVLCRAQNHNPIKLDRGQSMKLWLPFLLSAFPLASVAQSQPPSPQPPSGAPSPKTTEVMVILTARQGVTRQQIMNVMPDEIRATVKLYLEGKIRQWYSKGDGKGVILFLDAKTVDEAHAVIDAMPLSKENLVDHEYIPVGPLMPLGALIGAGPGAQ